MIENTRNIGIGMEFDTPFQANLNMTNANNLIQVTQYKINDQYKLDKNYEYQLIDWINSFGDPFLALVSKIPQDLENGIVLSHLVGYIVCSESDRIKIFELLNYP